jgi:ABC-type sugar transport system ATPase subunit
MNQSSQHNNEGQGNGNDKKKITIVANGSHQQVEKEEMIYEEIVTLAIADFPQHPERNYSIKYSNGHANKPEGILSPGGKIKVKPRF